MSIENMEFTLKGINPVKLCNSYGVFEHNISEFNTTVKHNTTPINLLNEDQTSRVTFLDESKREISCIAIPICSNDGNLLCFWCKHSSTIKDFIRCPIRYTPKQAVKRYNSAINDDVYMIKEAITEKRSKTIVDSNIKIRNEESYESYGHFCSYNCCMAFIIDSKKNPLFDQSELLLKQIYSCQYDIPIVNITPAPHWSLLKGFGGNLEITEFRKNFTNIVYINHGTSTIKPVFRPILTLFESQKNF